MKSINYKGYIVYENGDIFSTKSKKILKHYIDSRAAHTCDFSRELAALTN